LSGRGDDRVVGVDDNGWTTSDSRGKTEVHQWDKLSKNAVQQILKQVVDDTLGEDCLAASLLAFQNGDAENAVDYLKDAYRLQITVSDHLSEFAAVKFSDALERLDAKECERAGDALAEVRNTYGNTPWFKAHQDVFQGAQDILTAQIAEREAEELYRQAVQFLATKDLFDVQDRINEIRTEYPRCTLITDAARDPAFAELEQATANLGKRIAVCKNGQGDFTSVQEAIDDAVPDSLIEIADEGPYNESLTIIREKTGLTIRGVEGKWPVITSRGPTRDFPVLVAVRAPQTTFDRVKLMHAAPAGDRMRCVSIEDGSVRLRSSTVMMNTAADAIYIEGSQGRCEIQDSLVLGNINCNARLDAQNSVICGNAVKVAGRGCTLRHVTSLSQITLSSAASVLLDSIAPSIKASNPGHRIDSCDIFGKPPYLERASEGQNCLYDDPRFRNARELDFCLLSNSPCKDKASDGGDIGCQPTQEMQKMCQAAAKLVGNMR
jgi:hypothetical protein